MAKTPIPDLKRNRYYVDGNVAYIRVRQDALIDDGSISETPIPDLDRNSYYEDATTGLSYKRIIVGGFSSVHTDTLEENETTYVPVNHQFLINEMLCIEEGAELVLDGALAIS